MDFRKLTKLAIMKVTWNYDCDFIMIVLTNYHIIFEGIQAISTPNRQNPPPPHVLELRLSCLASYLSIDIAVFVRRWCQLTIKMSNNLSFRYFSKWQGFYTKEKKLTLLIKAVMNNGKNGNLKQKNGSKFHYF